MQLCIGTFGVVGDESVQWLTLESSLSLAQSRDRFHPMSLFVTIGESGLPNFAISMLTRYRRHRGTNRTIQPAVGLSPAPASVKVCLHEPSTFHSRLILVGKRKNILPPFLAVKVSR